MIKRVLLCIGWLAVAAMADPEPQHAGQAESAKSILDAWRATNVAETSRVLHVVLWSPSDREPVDGYGKRMDGFLQRARDFFAGEMNRLGFGPMAMRFDYEKDGMIRVHLAKGRRPLAEYKAGHAGEVREDCFRVLRASGIRPALENVIVFLNYPEGAGHTTGLALSSSAADHGGLAWIVDAPVAAMSGGMEQDASALAAKDFLIHRICHEIGLSLGLVAGSEPDAKDGTNGVSFMHRERGGSSFRFMTWADGLILASHPLFSQCRKQADGTDKVQVTDWMVEPADDGFFLKGRVEGSPPVYGIVAHLLAHGKEPLVTATAVPAVDGSFVLHCEGLVGAGDAEVRVVFLQVNGSASGYPGPVPHLFRYRVDSEGAVDATLTEATMVLVPFADALWRNDTQDVARLMQDPRIKEHAVFREIAERWVRRKEGRSVPPDQIVSSMALSDIRPVGAQTGYGPAVVDRLPGPQPLLISEGKLFAHGFYAHAPSTYSWDLQRKWSNLRGTAGLADGHPGSVVFQIEGDGGKLWTSAVVKPGELVPFDVDVSGVANLVLKTMDAGDGKSHDWSLWLEPVLTK